MGRFRKSSSSSVHFWKGRHCFEHWYRDNTVYFITARCRGRFPAFKAEQAKSIFWDRFDHYAKEYGFFPWITTLLDNHYHTLGYLKVGENLGPMMQKIHGSVAKLVNDTLETRHLPFWREAGHQSYFDGCLRDLLQCRRAYRYTLTQSRRHGVRADYQHYLHTHVEIEVECGIWRALKLKAFLENVPYKRYQKWKRSSGEDTAR